jgi:threonine/homoserine/homoserine lactone efflux protein
MSRPGSTPTVTMTPDLFTGMLVFTFVSAVTPGPNNFMVLASGVNFGFRRTIPHLAGITIGFGVMVLLAGLGAGHVFGRWPWAYGVLKVASILYMLWLAWKIATSGAVSPDAVDTAATNSRPMTFLEGALFQWVNPKAWTMCLGAISAYTVPDQYLSTMLIVVAAFVGWCPPCLSLWTVFGVRLRHVLSDPRRVRIFNLVMALSLVASLWPVVAEYIG